MCASCLSAWGTLHPGTEVAGADCAKTSTYGIHTHCTQWHTLQNQQEPETCESSRSELLEAMPPYQAGGEMIETVGLHESTYAPPPTRFEAGTPAIAEAIGFGAAADYVRGIGMDRIQRLEAELGGYLHQEVGRPAMRMRVRPVRPAQDST